MPAETESKKLYQDDYWTKYRMEQVGYGRDNVYAQALDWVAALHPDRGTLVDVGCGGGAFLELCRERGWRGIGVDPSSAAVDYARARGVEAHVQSWPPCSFGDEEADAVTFINVLDHLRDPLGALREAWRVLRPGGLLYVRVPNGPVHVTLLRLLSPVGLDHLAVFHLYGFGRVAFLYHLPRLGFSDVVVRTAAPSRRDAYGRTGTMFGLRHVLKLAGRAVYGLLKGTRLDRRAWGLSIEAMACKRRADGEC